LANVRSLKEAVQDRESRFEQRLSLIELRPPPVSGQPQQLALEGKLVFTEAAPLWKDLTQRLQALGRGETLNFDMSALEAIDGGTMALLAHLRAELKLRGVSCEFVGVREEIAPIVHLYHGDDKPVRRRKRRAESSLSPVGRATILFFQAAQGVFGFFGDMLLALAGLLKEPRTANWREVPHIMERTGADAIPIVALINFLVGFVMAFQGAVQLKQFGANVFVADLVGLSVTRELGPLMTAIILCGRTGAAFAAELGSMQVSEEIDALRTLGFGPIRYLVLPRAFGLMLVAPILTLLADCVGILGGLVVALTSLDLTIGSYVNETRQALDLWDVFSGVLKSVVFALAIALISCQQGFAAQGGAEGVGRRTTSSVVSILFSLILIDAGFTVLFYEFGL
jgi:phospholipid/cholesterol/gamma-HCH transport system permease protein